MDNEQLKTAKACVQYLKSIDESLKILSGRLSKYEHVVKKESYAESYFKRPEQKDSK